MGKKNIIFKYGDVKRISFVGCNIIVASLLLHLIGNQKKQKEIINKICNSDISKIYFFDRVRGCTKEEEERYLGYFASNLQKKGLPAELIEELTTESRSNSPMSFKEQKYLFNKKGFESKILFKNPNHGFMAYMFYL
ncbi:MAG: hypothetical protein ABIF17_02420 [Patescibacteria group bacterium]